MSTITINPYTPAWGYNPATMAQAGMLRLLRSHNIPVDIPYDNKIVPVSLQLPEIGESSRFTLPLDPLVSVSGKNNIACRNIACNDGSIHGTVKEKWNRDDWDITIAGLMIADQYRSLNDNIQLLRTYIEYNKAIEIVCEYLNVGYEILYVVIESFDFPFTKGEDYQTYTLKCKSDDSNINLLI